MVIEHIFQRIGEEIIYLEVGVRCEAIWTEIRLREMLGLGSRERAEKIGFGQRVGGIGGWGWGL